MNWRNRGDLARPPAAPPRSGDSPTMKPWNFHAWRLSRISAPVSLSVFHRPMSLISLRIGSFSPQVFMQGTRTFTPRPPCGRRAADIRNSRSIDWRLRQKNLFVESPSSRNRRTSFCPGFMTQCGKTLRRLRVPFRIVLGVAHLLAHGFQVHLDVSLLWCAALPAAAPPRSRWRVPNAPDRETAGKGRGRYFADSGAGSGGKILKCHYCHTSSGHNGLFGGP